MSACHTTTSRGALLAPHYKLKCKGKGDSTHGLELLQVHHPRFDVLLTRHFAQLLRKAFGGGRGLLINKLLPYEPSSAAAGERVRGAYPWPCLSATRT